MNDIMGQPILKMGTLYFIPVNQPMRSVPLSIDGPDYGQTRFVTTSGHDQFHDEAGDLHWVTIEIPAAFNGDTRIQDDILRELDNVYHYLHEQGLVPNPTAPLVQEINPLKIMFEPA